MCACVYVSISSFIRFVVPFHLKSHTVYYYYSLLISSFLLLPSFRLTPPFSSYLSLPLTYSCLRSLSPHSSLSYTIGKHSNDPHLSRLFLGAIYFKQGLYSLALRQYNTALRMISEIHGSLYSVQDDFCVKYNRHVCIGMDMYLQSSSDLKV